MTVRVKGKPFLPTTLAVARAAARPIEKVFDLEAFVLATNDGREATVCVLI
jgi:hypothetical protein